MSCPSVYLPHLQALLPCTARHDKQQKQQFADLQSLLNSTACASKGFDALLHTDDCTTCRNQSVTGGWEMAPAAGICHSGPGTHDTHPVFAFAMWNQLFDSTQQC